MIARDINLVVPLPPTLLLVRYWGRWILRLILFTSSVLFTINSTLLLPRSPLPINAFLSNFTQLAFPLPPRGAVTRRAATSIEGFPFAFTIAVPATATTSTPTTAAATIDEEGVFSTSEETRSKVKPFFSTILGGCRCRHQCGRGCGCGYERHVRMRRLGTERGGY